MTVLTSTVSQSIRVNLSRPFGPSEGPVAESVFIGGMFVKYGKEYADLCAYTGDQTEADRAMKEVAAMNDAVLDRRLGRRLVCPCV